MKKVNFYYLLSIILFLLASCEDAFVKEVKAPPTLSKVVAIGFLSPDQDTISIKVFRSIPIFTSQTTSDWFHGFEPISNATVKLSNENSEIVLRFSKATNSYFALPSTFPIKKGSTYNLRIETGDNIVVSSCTIPDTDIPSIELFSIDSLVDQQNLGLKLYYANLGFKDNPESGDYYHLKALDIHKFYYGKKYHYSFSIMPFETGNEYSSDMNNNDVWQKYRLRFTSPYSNQLSVDSIYVALSVTDDNYYHYNKSLQNHNGQNPFIDPVPIYSNISGGLGVFCGLRTHITTIAIKN